MQPYTDKDRYRASKEDLAKLRRVIALEVCKAMIQNFDPKTDLGTFVIMGGGYTIADALVELIYTDKPKKEDPK